LDQATNDLRADLEATGKGKYFRVFERYDLNPAAGDPPTYEKLGAKLGISKKEIGTYLTHCRARLRTFVLNRIRDYVDSESEAAGELGHIFALLTQEGK